MTSRLSVCFESRRKRPMRLSWFGAGRSRGVSRGSVRGRVGVLLAGAVVAAAAVAAGAGPVSAQEGFEDSGSGTHGPNIDALAEMGVFEGTECGVGLFCPGESVSRWVMAVWLVRVLDGADPEAGGGSRFVDVDANAWWSAHVERLAELKVTLGCAVAMSFCPDDPVTRGQMASFLVRAFDLEAGPDAGFVDVDGGVHGANINALAASGVTKGCELDPPRYCPSGQTKRSHMATFLKRGIDHAAAAEVEEPAPAPAPAGGGGGGGGGTSSTPSRPSPPSRPPPPQNRATVVLAATTDGPYTGTFIVTLTFSEDVEDLPDDFVVVTDGSLVGRLSGDARVWTATVEPDPGFEGDLTVTVKAGAAGVDASASVKTVGRFKVDTLAPTVTVSGPSGTPTEQFDAHLVWSEPVNEFYENRESNIFVTGGELTDLQEQGQSRRRWTAQIEPRAGTQGDVELRLLAGAASDDAGNESERFTKSFAVDNSAPLLVSAEIDGDELTLTFSEPLGAASASVRARFTVTVTDSISGVEGTRTVRSLSVTDELLVLELNAPVRHDDTVTVSYTPGVPAVEDEAGNDAAALDNESVDNETPASSEDRLSSLRVSEGSISFRPSQTVYDTEVGNTVTAVTVTAAATDDRATVTWSVRGAAVSDGVDIALNVGANVIVVKVTAEDGSSSQEYRLTVTREADVDTPTVEITRTSGPSGTQPGPFTVRFRWSEMVMGFDSNDDVIVSNGTLSDLTQDTGNPLIWTATVTPDDNDQGTVTVTVEAGRASDGTNNPSVRASSAFLFDTLGPTVVKLSTPKSVVKESFDVTVVFDQRLRSSRGFTMTADPDGRVNVANGRIVSQDHDTYTYTMRFSSIEDGPVALSIPAGHAFDELDNSNKTASDPLSLTVDLTAPTVTTWAASKSGATYLVDITFSEPVTGFAADDISVSKGTTLGSFNGSDTFYQTVYQVPVTPTADGTVTLTIRSGAVEDRAGNSNPAETYSFDANLNIPTVTLSIDAPANVNKAFDVTITFSEPVTGFDADDMDDVDIVVQNGSKSGFSGSRKLYTVEITGDSDGVVTVNVPANVALDTGDIGNGNEASESLERNWDATPPTVTLTTDPPDLEDTDEPFTVNFDFGEAVFGFKEGDIVVEHSTLSNFTGTDGDQSYSVLVTPNNEGAVTVTVPADAARDAARNANEEADLSIEESLSAYIEREHIIDLEDDFPWLRQAWRNHQPPVTIVSGRRGATWKSDVVTSEEGFRGLLDGRIEFRGGGERNEYAVIHELAHHFTLDYRAADEPGPVGVGWLYAHNRLEGHGRACDPLELYADLISHETDSSYTLEYVDDCSRTMRTADTLDDESSAVINSVIGGTIPDWLDDHYQDMSGKVDLDTVWADIRGIGDRSATVAYQMRDMFGGFCSLSNLAMGWIYPALMGSGNPWVDGRCEWRKPQDLTLIANADSIFVYVESPRFTVAPTVDRYLLELRINNTLVRTVESSNPYILGSVTRIPYTFTGLDVGTKYSVRVAAVNTGSKTQLNDDEGYIRWVEDSAVPGQLGRPTRNVAVVSGNGALVVSWDAPLGYGDLPGVNNLFFGPVPADFVPTGYVVEWKSGSESYDATRRQAVTGSSARTATIPNLTNGQEYTLRVTAVGASNTQGAPSAEVTATAGQPAAPTGVTTTAGDGFLDVAWEAAGDNGTTVSRYVVQWKYDGNGQMTGGNYNTRRQAIKGASATSHRIEGLNHPGEYSVRVIAVNAHGRGAAAEVSAGS